MLAYVKIRMRTLLEIVDFIIYALSNHPIKMTFILLSHFGYIGHTVFNHSVKPRMRISFPVASNTVFFETDNVTDNVSHSDRLRPLGHSDKLAMIIF